jgi:tRNA A37 threonylcarbamoyladenosine synthetase subunit TsaC/SUA5/YrdC
VSPQSEHLPRFVLSELLEGVSLTQIAFTSANLSTQTSAPTRDENRAQGSQDFLPFDIFEP